MSSKYIIAKNKSNVKHKTLTFVEVIKQIKEQVDIFQLAQEFGYKVRGNKILCFLHNEKTPSCHLYQNTNSYFCFGCKIRGSVIDFYMHHKNLSFKDACRNLAARLGIELPEESEEDKQTREKELNQQQEMEKLVVGCWAGKLRKKEINYLKERGFTEQFIQGNSFGYCSRKTPADKKVAKDLGLLLATKNEREWYMPTGRFIIPFWQYGRLVQVAFHRPSGNPKYLYPKGWKKPLVGNLKPGSQPILVEGVFCFFSLLQTGISSITGLGTHLSKEQKRQLRRVGDFFICFDNEPEAQKTARKLAKEFFPFAKVIEIPEGKDVNKLLQKLGQEEFKEFILDRASKAQSYLQLILRDIQASPQDEWKRKETIELIALLDDLERDVFTDELHKILKPLGVKKTTLEKAIKIAVKKQLEEQTSNNYEKKNQQDILIELAEEADLFKNEHRDPFARIPVNGHKEIWPVRSRDFKLWLTGKYFDKTGKGPNSEALSSALNTISAKAWKSDQKHKLHVRVAWHDGSIFYDLANDKWQAVRVYPGGWEIVDEPPILFRRFSHMDAQSTPDPEGEAKKILQFVNIGGTKKEILYLCSLVATFVPDIPQIIKVFFGCSGSGKTFTSKVDRAAVDPSSASTCRSYRDQKEFLQHLAHNHCIVLDNLSSIGFDLSDLICGAVTGDGATKRALYTDDDDIIYSFKRCFIINGINNVVTKEDLLRRSILFYLEKPDPCKVKEEQELWKEFQEAKPQIIGGIFNVLAKAMEVRPRIKLDGLYEMADFTRWGAAIAEGLGYGSDAFLQAYWENKEQQTEEAISNNPVAAAVKSFMGKFPDGVWTGPFSELLTELEKIANKEKINIKTKGWPKAANALSRKLNEIKTTLKQTGIEVIYDRTSTSRKVTLQITENIVTPVKNLLDRGPSNDDINSREKIPSQISLQEKPFNNGNFDYNADKAIASTGRPKEKNKAINKKKNNKNDPENLKEVFI